MYISFAADRWTQYCDQRISVSVYLFVCLFICLFVCLFVCPLAKAISKTTRPNVNKFLYGPTCYLWPWRNAPLTAMRYVMYFRFVDDVIFLQIERMGKIRDDAYVSYRVCHVAAPVGRQTTLRRYVWSRSPGVAAPGAKSAVCDFILLLV